MQQLVAPRRLWRTSGWARTSQTPPPADRAVAPSCGCLTASRGERQAPRPTLRPVAASWRPAEICGGQVLPHRAAPSVQGQRPRSTGACRARLAARIPADGCGARADMQAARALLWTLVALAAVLLAGEAPAAVCACCSSAGWCAHGSLGTDQGACSAGVQLAPSLKAHTHRFLEDRAHRRLLEQQDEHYLDPAGLALHRRAGRVRGHRGHKMRERMMQAGARPRLLRARVGSSCSGSHRTPDRVNAQATGGRCAGHRGTLRPSSPVCRPGHALCCLCPPLVGTGRQGRPRSICGSRAGAKQLWASAGPQVLTSCAPCSCAGGGDGSAGHHAALVGRSAWRGAGS